MHAQPHLAGREDRLLELDLLQRRPDAGEDQRAHAADTRRPANGAKQMSRVILGAWASQQSAVLAQGFGAAGLNISLHPKLPTTAPFSVLSIE